MSPVRKWLTYSACSCKSHTVRLTGADCMLRVGYKTKRLPDDRVACVHCFPSEPHTTLVHLTG